MSSFQFKKIKIGKKRSLFKIIKTTDIESFSKISGDNNKIHQSKKNAKKKGFDNQVVHGAIIFAQFSKLIGTKIPGNNALILEIKLKFHNAAYPGKKIYFFGQVKEKYNSVKCILLNLEAKYQNKKIIAKGNALIKLL